MTASCKHDWAINNHWDGMVEPAPYPIIQCIRCNETSAGAAPPDEYRKALARCVEALGFVAVNVSWDNVQPGVESMVIEALYPARALLEGTDR